LVGFGSDSTIEVLSAWVVAWQIPAELRGGYDEERERRALRLIGVTFFVLVMTSDCPCPETGAGGPTCAPSAACRCAVRAADPTEQVTGSCGLVSRRRRRAGRRLPAGR